MASLVKVLSLEAPAESTGQAEKSLIAAVPGETSVTLGVDRSDVDLIR